MVSHCGWHSSLYSTLQALLLFQGSCHSLVVTGDSAVEDAEAGMYNVDTLSEMTPQLANVATPERIGCGCRWERRSLLSPDSLLGSCM